MVFFLHTHFQSWECSISPPNFMDFVGHRKSWNRRNFCRVSHLNKNIEKKSTSFFYHKLSGQSKVVKSYFRLAYSALFPYGKILCHGVFLHTHFPWWKNLAPDLPALEKIIHVCLSYSTPSVLRVFGMASQFYGFFRTQEIQKSEELMSSFTFKQKYWK